MSRPNVSSFQHAKVSVDFSPAEQSTAAEFRSRASERRRDLGRDDRDAANDKISLERKVAAAVAEFDARLVRLYAERIAVEKCVLAEELKVLIHDRHLAMLDGLEREEEKQMWD